MKALWTAYFIVVTVIFFLIEFPRQDVARYYLARLEAETGVNVIWQGPDSTFGFRSAHLTQVTVLSGGQSMIDLSSVDAVFEIGSLSFVLTRGAGQATGSYDRSNLDLQLKDFPLPVAADWVTNLSASGTGHFILAEQNGSGTVDLHAEATQNMAPFGVQGKLQATGDYRLQHGNLELHAGVVGDKLHGHLDLMATRMTPNWLLSGTLALDVNGQPRTVRISGTSAAPHTEVSNGGPGGPPSGWPPHQ